jgi:hypothetical protein
MNIVDMHLFPHEWCALYATLCRDLRSERDNAARHPERRDYHEYNAYMSARLLELLFPEAMRKTLPFDTEGLCNDQLIKE